MEPDDRRALDRLKSDQEHRDWLEARRRDNWRRLKTATAIVGALLAAAVTLQQLLHLLGLS